MTCPWGWMPGASKKPPTRRDSESRRTFDAHYARLGDYRTAAARAGVSERTGRRWRQAFLEDPGPPTTSDPSQSRYLTTFVGRQNELNSVEARLNECRVVSVVGPPGIGKSRIADELAQRSRTGQDRFSFCDLRHAHDLHALCREVARACFGSGTDDLAHSVTTVGRFLRAQGRLTIILDNAESSGHAFAGVLGQWRDVAPQVRFLATSRRPLEIAGESIFELGALDLRSREDSASDAANLFAQRASHMDPALQIGPRERTTIDEVVRRLEGIPLAIEIAAAQTARFGLRELLERIPFDGPEPLPSAFLCDPQHRTLRSAIDGSWEALSRAEQQTFAQLSVFRGGFTAEAVEHVVEGGSENASAIDQVLALRRASLVLALPRPDPDGSKRWDLLVSLRDYAREKLVNSGSSSAVRRRHADYFLAWGERQASALVGEHGRVAWLQLEHEFPNLEVAFHSFHSLNAVPELVRTALVLFDTTRRNRPREILPLLTLALERTQNAEDVSRQHRTRLFLARAVANRDIEDYEAAVADFEEARAFTTVGEMLTGEIDYEQGELCAWKGDFIVARRLLERAIATAEQTGASHLEARARRYLARTLVEAFEDAEGFEHYAKSIALFERLGDRRATVVTRKMWCIHRLFLQRGDPGPELESALSDLAKQGDQINEAAGHTGMGLYHHEQGRLVEARVSYEKARSLSRQLGLGRVEGVSELRVGIVAQEEGRLDEAMLHYRRSIETFSAVSHQRFVTLGRIYLAGLVAQCGNWREAEILLDQATDTIGELGRTGLRGLPELQRAQVDLTRQQQALAQGNRSVAKTLLVRVRERLAEAGQPRSPARDLSGSPPIRLCNPEARLLARLIEHRLAQPSSAPQRLAVWDNGTAFQVGLSPLVSMPNGPVLRRLLALLASSHAQKPGQAVSADEILSSCWPNERILPQSAGKRLREAIRRLRRLGLENLISANDSGYLIDPTATVTVIESPNTP